MEWRVIRTLSRQERKAFDALTEAGFLAYLPCEVRRVKIGAGSPPARLALFPGYLFAQITEEDVCKVNRLDGIIGLLSPHPIKQEAVQAIQEAEEAGAFDQTRKDLQRRFIRGEWVKVRSGAYSGWVGEVIRSRGSARVTILAKMFGRGHKVDVPTEALEAA